MDIEQGLAIANEAVFDTVGRRLSTIELAILRGCWQDQTYDAIAKRTDYSVGYLNRTVAPKLWQILSDALGEKVSKKNFRFALERLWRMQQESGEERRNQEDSSRSQKFYVDWGEAIDVSVFYGRHEELKILNQWVLQDRCRLVAILGMGGIGKTALSVKLAHQIIEAESKNERTGCNPQHFELVIWRSLRNAPSLNALLSDIILTLSQQQEVKLPETNTTQISRLLHYLKQHRCLIVLDNAESILKSGNQVGRYLPGYESYGELLQRCGEGMHQSCLIVTSREKPPEIPALEGGTLPVRSLQLTGLGIRASSAIFDSKQLFGSDNEKLRLVNRYGGNPLALKIVSTSIHDLFRGKIAEFLAQGTTIFNGIRLLLDQQFDRLSDLEQQVMYWLAINREWVSLPELQADLIPPVAKHKLLEALEYLERRSLIECSPQGFTQQPVVMEYMTEKLIETVYDEICRKTPKLLSTYALLKAQTKDYIRETQFRVIVQPLIAQLLSYFGTQQAIAQQVKQILQDMRQEPHLQLGYGAGNVLNLLCYLPTDLSGYDFSGLTIRQADLRQVSLKQVNLAHAHLINSAFSESLGNLYTVAISPDNTLAAKVGNDGMICVWQIATGQRVLTLAAHASFIWKALDFSPDGRFLVSGGYDHFVKLWDATTGKCVQTWYIGNSVLATAFSPDCKLVACSTDDNTIQLWDVQAGKSLRTLSGSQAQVMGLAFHPNSYLLATSGVEPTARLWDISTGECVQTFTHTDITWAVAFNAQGTQLATGSADSSIKLWDVKTGQCLHTLEGHQASVNAIAYTANGSTLVSGSSDGTVRLWDTQQRKCLKVLLQGGEDVIWTIRSFSNSSIIASGADDGTIRFWDTNSGQCIRTLQGDTIAFRTLACNNQGNLLISGSENRQIRVWGLSPGRCLKVLEEHITQVWGTAFHPQKNWFATSDIGGKVCLWELDEQSDARQQAPAIARLDCQLKAVYQHTHWVQAVTFHPQDDVVVTGSGDAVIRFWDVSTGDLLKTMSDEGDRVILAVAFHPQGHLLASVSNDPLVRVWNVETGECFMALQGHTSRNWTVAFHPEGHLVATGGDDHMLKVWDTNTGKCFVTLQEHKSSICSVVFSPDGTLMASSSTDRTIRIWDTTTWECLRMLEGHAGSVISIAFQPSCYMKG